MLSKESGSNKNKKTNIAIVGDATSDVFQKIDDQDDKTEELKGGIFFVNNMLKSVLDSNKADVLGYNETPNPKDLPKVIWKTKKVGDKGVFRCVQTFDTRQSLNSLHKSYEQTMR